VTPRSLLLHLAFLAIAAGCVIAAWWQIHRAMQGNALSYLYSVEWPAFVLVAGIGWWQMVHDTPEDIERRRAHHARMRAASAEVVARTLPRSARAITVGSEDVGGRRLPKAASIAAIRGEGAAGRAAGGAPTTDLAVRQGQEAGGGLADGGLAGSPRPEDEYQAILLEASEDDSGPSDPMTEYNRYLALLAIKGKPKTWRNPRGL
jgi:hypothetical protein